MKIRAIILTILFALFTLGNVVYADSSLETAGADIKGRLLGNIQSIMLILLKPRRLAFTAATKQAFMKQLWEKELPIIK